MIRFMRAAVAALILAAVGAAALACEPVHRVTGSNSIGAYAVVFCDDGFTIVPRTYAVRWEAATPAMQADFVELGNAKDLPSAIAAMVKKHSTLHVTAEELFEVYADAADKIAAAHPPSPMWRVARNGVTPDRPAYPYGDERGKRSTARAVVGADCDASERFVEGKTVYAKVAEGLVAV
jgi:hypothetical protein